MFYVLSFFIDGKPIPTELRKDEGELRKLIEYDDEARDSKSILVMIEQSLNVDFLSSQKPRAMSQRVLGSSQNHLQSSHEYDNLLNIGLTYLSN